MPHDDCNQCGEFPSALLSSFFCVLLQMVKFSVPVGIGLFKATLEGLIQANAKCDFFVPFWLAHLSCALLSCFVLSVEAAVCLF